MARRVKLYTPEKFKKVLTDIIRSHGDVVVFEGEDFGISFQHDHIFEKHELGKPIANIHFSDTEKVRGCNLISYAIVSGWSTTAVTYHWIDEGIDTGPIIARRIVPITGIDTSKTLYNRCVQVAIDSLPDIYPLISGLKEGVPNESGSPYVPREPFDRQLELTPEQERFIRSRLFPGKPKPYVVVCGEEMEIG